MPSWSRPEPFGAWIRLDDATLVAVDTALASRLGVPRAGEALGQRVRPLELHVAVTARCGAGCVDCYVDAQPDGFEPPFETLRAALVRARDAGVATVAFGGGEPLSRRDIGALAAEARALGLVPVMTTSGLGLTEGRARELASFAQINVSHDGVGDAYEAVRGWPGAPLAERAIAALAAAGIAVGVNVVLTRASFEHLEATAARVAQLGARELQLLRFKPAGRAASIAYLEQRLSRAQRDRLWPAIERLVAAKQLAIRIDCAMVPLLSEALLRFDPEGAAARLEALGVFGCEAARHLGALRVDGRLGPCSFADGGDAPSAEPIGARWDSDRALEAFRAYHAAPSAPCDACPLFAVCRGGCQVVARHATGAFGPDPECPGVENARALRSPRGEVSSA